MNKSHQSILHPVVSVEWLQDHIDHPQLVLLDASWYMPNAQRDGRSEWLAERIGNAQFFDFDKEICNPDTDLPHMAPSPEQFNEHARALGINDNSWIVFYDGAGLFSSPRARWLMQLMGHRECAVLNGGLPAWKAKGLPTNTSTIQSAATGQFTAQLSPRLVSNAEQVLAAQNSNLFSIIDARPAGRFAGKDPEPRPGLRSGHMPNSQSLPFDQLIDNGQLKSSQALKEIFADKTTPNQTIITTCGSGVTACVLALGAELAGYSSISVYDGSWAEWGGDHALPVETS